MAKFKCKQSGNVFEFLNEHDIKTMRTHSSYEEVKEDMQEVKEETQKRTLSRPKKD